MGCLNSYAYFIPFGSPLPIVSIKIGNNGREECKSDARICSKSVEGGQGSRSIEHL